MPNHVTNRVTIRGDAEALKKFVRDYVSFSEEKGLYLDFNRIIPIPKALQGVQSGGQSELGYKAWYGNWKELLEYPWVKTSGVKTRKELQGFLMKRDPQYKEGADLYNKNIKKYGYPTWYEWSINNWGTKWNSYAFEFIREMGPRDWGNTEIEFIFDTAWGVPEPVFNKLSEENPKLSFSVISFEDMWGFAGRGEYEEGTGSFTLVKPTKKIYKEVYGEEPEEGEA